MRSRSISVVAASVLAACGGAPEIDVDGVWADYVETGVDFPTQEIECTREGVLTLTQDGERFHGTFDGTKTCVSGSDTFSVTGRWDVTHGIATKSMDLLIDRPRVGFRLDECGHEGTVTGAHPADTIRGGGQCSTAVHVGGLDSADIVFGFTATR